MIVEGVPHTVGHWRGTDGVLHAGVNSVVSDRLRCLIIVIVGTRL